MPVELHLTTSFQSFVQALGLHVFGPGLQVYGLGPDGGRDASFDGRPNYPSSEDPWEGYTVIQAKYRDTPSNDTRDADWLANQIKRDLAAMRDADKNIKRPNFYLLVTNVELSAVPPSEGSRRRKGGLAKVEEAIASFQSAIGFKKYAVWHAEKLRRLLDAAPDELRRTYASWVTPSDLIWDLLNKLAKPDLLAAVALAVARDLRENRYTRLQEAGHVDAEATLITQVFFDLPREPTRTGVARGNTRGVGRDGSHDDAAAGVVASLCTYSCSRFTAKSKKGTLATAGPRAASGRVVVMGGPGQGKSTIAQFLIQLFQANLLASAKVSGLSYETSRNVDDVLNCARNAGIRTELPFRVPIRISLPLLADSISDRKKGDGRLTVIQLVAQQLSTLSGSIVSIDDVRDLMRGNPIAMVLDGLDEVPSSGDRSAVLAEIESFFDEIAATDADALVVVTTRPQGYNKDLNPEVWEHWELAALNRAQALGYARKLANVRLAEQSKKDRVLSRLDEASRSAATAQLLISPLQVAILFTLVDLKGDVPTDRWSLFDRYFGVLRDREEEKGGPSGELLKRYRTLVERIHQLAGCLLHVGAEVSGGAESFLTQDQFEQLVENLLQEEGHQGASLRRLVRDLKQLATNRLVLLSSRIEDRIAFDVRSLQEYMAAAMLTASRDEEVEARLRTVAGTSHWRHAFQIAASRCFSDTGKRHLAGTIVNVCAELDAGADDPGDATALSGARLALDLLADGIGLDSPRSRMLLFDRAVRLLDLGPDLYDDRLASIVDSYSKRACIDSLKERLRCGSKRRELAAWRLVIGLIRQRKAWARDLLSSFWPVDVSQQMNIVDLEIFERLTGFIRTKFVAAFVDAGFEATAGMRQQREYLTKAFGFPGDSEWYDNLSRSGAFRVTLDMPEDGVFGTVAICRLVQPRLLERFAGGREYGAKWPPFAASAEFSNSPSPSTLSSALRSVSGLSITALHEIAALMPWPLGTLVKFANTSEQLQELANTALSGEFGDARAWYEAEDRWARIGITSNDLKYARKIRKYFDKNVGSVGIPSWITLILGDHPTVERLAPAKPMLKAELEQFSSEHLRRELFHTVTYLERTLEVLEDDSEYGLYLLRSGILSPRSFIHFAARATAEKRKSIANLDRIGNEIPGSHIGSIIYASGTRFDDLRLACFEALKDNNSLTGLLPIIALITRPEDYGRISFDCACLDELSIAEQPPVVAISTLMLRLMLDRVPTSKRKQVISSLIDLHESEVGNSTSLVGLVKALGTNPKNVRAMSSDTFLRTMRGQSERNKERYIGALKNFLDQRRSPLVTYKHWIEVGLPGEIFEMVPSNIAPK